MPRKKGSTAEVISTPRSRLTRRSNTHIVPPSKRKKSPESDPESDDDYEEASTSFAKKGKRGGISASRGRGGSKSKRSSFQVKQEIEDDYEDEDEKELEDVEGVEDEDLEENETSLAEESPEVTPKKQTKPATKKKKKRLLSDSSSSPTPSRSPSPLPEEETDGDQKRGRKSVPATPSGKGKKGKVDSENKRSAPPRRKKQVTEDDEDESPELKKLRERAERKQRRIDEAKDRPKLTLEEKLEKLSIKKDRRERRKEREKEESMRQKYGDRKIKAEANKWNFGPISSINQRKREEMLAYFPKANYTSETGVPPVMNNFRRATVKYNMEVLNPFITCSLCNGYFVDATTIVDCMHTFCKRCLLHYFESDNKSCPTCGTFIHGSHPTHYVKYDRSLNDLVNQFVPKMEDKEAEERKNFLRDCRESLGIDTAAEDRERAERLERERVTGTNRCYPLEPARLSHHRDDCQVTVNLLPGTANLPLITRPFVRCSEMTTMNTLKKFISLQIWDDQNRYGDLDIFCDGQLMGKDFSIRFVWMMKRRGQPKSEPLVIRYHMTRS